MDLKLISSDLTKNLVIIFLAAGAMVSVAYGVTDMYTKWSISPVPFYVALLLFSIGFMISSVFFEKRDAEFPWSLIGGAVASSCATFLITAAVVGIADLKAQGIVNVNFAYAFSVSMILSTVIVHLVKHRL